MGLCDCVCVCLFHPHTCANDLLTNSVSAGLTINCSRERAHEFPTERCLPSKHLVALVKTSETSKSVNPLTLDNIHYLQNLDGQTRMT